MARAHLRVGHGLQRRCRQHVGQDPVIGQLFGNERKLDLARCGGSRRVRPGPPLGDALHAPAIAALDRHDAFRPADGAQFPAADALEDQRVSQLGRVRAQNVGPDRGVAAEEPLAVHPVAAEPRGVTTETAVDLCPHGRRPPAALEPPVQRAQKKSEPQQRRAGVQRRGTGGRQDHAFQPQAAGDAGDERAEEGGDGQHPGDDVHPALAEVGQQQRQKRHLPLRGGAANLREPLGEVDGEGDAGQDEQDQPRREKIVRKRPPRGDAEHDEAQPVDHRVLRGGATISSPRVQT